MNRSSDIIIIGAGIFGAAAAVELRRRGHSVTLLEAGAVPHDLAASTDISKVVRMEYGPDEAYMGLMEVVLPKWRQWNEVFGETLFHETGMAILSRQPMAPGSFEHDSFRMLLRRGHEPVRLNAEQIVRRFPAWKPGTYVDGFYNPQGGFALSGRVVAALAGEAARMGVTVLDFSRVASIETEGSRVAGLRMVDGRRLSCKTVIVAAGAWTPELVPDLAVEMRITGHPIFHLRPENPTLFTMDRFSTYMTDISRTGWYGFPLHPTEGVVKVSNHGVGQRLGPDDDRIVTGEDEASLREFLRESLPALADAPIVYTRRCLYCDTLDEHFWIDEHPETAGLFVATGGSGHGFKFGPVLGELIADAVEKRPSHWLPKFQWRSLEGRTGEEASRRR